MYRLSENFIFHDRLDQANVNFVTSQLTGGDFFCETSLELAMKSVVLRAFSFFCGSIYRTLSSF